MGLINQVVIHWRGPCNWKPTLKMENKQWIWKGFDNPKKSIHPPVNKIQRPWVQKTNTGWWFQSSEKYWSIGMIIPNIWEIKVMFQTTNQNRSVFTPSIHLPFLAVPGRRRRQVWVSQTTGVRVTLPIPCVARSGPISGCRGISIGKPWENHRILWWLNGIS